MIEYIGKGHLNDKQRRYKEMWAKWSKCRICKGINSPKICECEGSGYALFLHNFIKDDKSSNTTDKHIRYLVKFCLYLKEHGFSDLENIQDLATFYKVKDSQDDNIIFLEKCVGNYIRYLRDERGTGESDQKNNLGTINKAYEHNRVNLLKSELYAIVGEDEDRDDPWGYNLQQIKSLMFNAKLITYKALIALLASTGARRGAIWDTATIKNGPKKGQHNYLRLKDLQIPTTNLKDRTVRSGQQTAGEYIMSVNPDILQKPVYMITFYRGSRKSEYQTFCSHEAYNLINQMLQQRRDAGENNPVPEESLQEWIQRNPYAPVFRNRFRSTPYQHCKCPSKVPRELRRRENCAVAQPLSLGAIKKYMENLRNGIGDSVKFTPMSEGHHRIPVLHGFMHFHQPAMSEAGINSDVSEWLQGRKLEVSRQAYSRGSWPDYMRLVEYWKVMDMLTIDREDIKDRKIEEKNKIISKERMEREHAERVTYVVAEKQRIDQERTDNKLAMMMETMSNQYELIRELLPLLPEDKRKNLPEHVVKKLSSDNNSSPISLEDKSLIVDITDKQKEDHRGASN